MHPIYAKEGPQMLSEKADHLLALSRIGLAASDSTLNLDLEDCGYCGLFEVMALISADLSDTLISADLPKRAAPDPDFATAKAYLSGHAASLNLTPPATLVDSEGALTDAVLAYCKEHSISLDYLFPSDPQEAIQ